MYQEKFTDVVLVTLHTDRIGNQLNDSSEVKARGVVVGDVRSVRGSDRGAAIELALDPDKVAQDPQGRHRAADPEDAVRRALRPTVHSGLHGAGAIAAGDVIRQDRSANAIELERVFDDLLPVLKAVQPQKLATTLTAIATALEGRGKRLGDAMVDTAALPRGLQPEPPAARRRPRATSRRSASCTATSRPTCSTRSPSPPRR